jgi:DNA-binding transcriptional ArsR family regulator
MPPTDAFSTYYTDQLDGRYDCVDRLVINAYYPLGHSPAGFRTWWRALTGSDDTLDNTHLMRMAGRFSRRVHAYAKANAIPLIHCESGTRKHELAEQALPTAPEFRGVFLILVARAMIPLWEITRTEAQIQDIHHKTAYVNHYYFHILDPEWGHLCIKLCSHPPFPATIMLNGHEWVERQALQQELAFTKEGNCFTDANSWHDLDLLADALSTPSAIGRLIEVIQRWLTSACLIFALDQAEQEQSGFHYALSCYQLEYSRNLVFQHGTTVDRVFQGLIDRTRSTLDVKTLTTLFGAKRRPFKHQDTPGPAPRLQCTLERPTHHLTVFKLHFGLLTLKIYDKGERVLRVEAIAHNAKALKQGRVLAQLPALVAALQGMALRFLDVLHAAHPAVLDLRAADDLARPSETGAIRVAGIDLRSPRMRAAVHALLALGPAPTGFGARDLACTVRAQTGWDETQYTLRHARYDFKKLRGKGLVTRIGRTRRYEPVLPQYQTACAAVLLHEQVFTPVLSSVAHQRCATKLVPQHPLDQHYDTLRRALLATMQAVGIAA